MELCTCLLMLHAHIRILHGVRVHCAPRWPAVPCHVGPTDSGSETEEATTPQPEGPASSVSHEFGTETSLLITTLQNSYSALSMFEIPCCLQTNSNSIFLLNICVTILKAIPSISCELLLENYLKFQDTTAQYSDAYVKSYLYNYTSLTA